MFTPKINRLMKQAFLIQLSFPLMQADKLAGLQAGKHICVCIFLYQEARNL